MNNCAFSFRSETLMALPSGGLWWPDQSLLCVSDLHLGKSDRIARRSGAMLPPYDTRETLIRLSEDIARTEAKHVVCLGDSFDDLSAARDLNADGLATLKTLMAGRDWTWIEGNHDPGPIDLGGRHVATLRCGVLVFRHIATPGASGEVSGHYHPKARIQARGRSLSRRCFLLDADRLILPAYGTYTGGLFSDDKALSGLMASDALAFLLPGHGKAPLPVPMPRDASSPSSRNGFR